MRALQQIRQLALLTLQLRVPANVLLSDENVRHGTLRSDFLQSILNLGSIVCAFEMAGLACGLHSVFMQGGGGERTDLVQFDNVGLCAQLAQESLRLLAEGAV